MPSKTLCDLGLTGFRDLVSLHGRQQIQGSWNLQRLPYFIKRMLEYIYGRRILCFKERIYAMHTIDQGNRDLFDQVSIADLPWLCESSWASHYLYMTYASCFPIPQWSVPH